MSYWTSDTNLVKIGEEQISVPADQGLSHTVGQNSRKVSFVVPKSTEFIDGKSCYLEFDCKINTPVHAAGDGKTRLMIDPAGCGMLCQNVRIYDLESRRLLEEIQDYNQLVALQSDYDTDESSKGLKALTQGGGVYQPRCSGSRGSTKSDRADLITNPWFKTQTNATKSLAQQGDYDHATQSNSVKACVPLDLTGIFSGSIFPNMMVGLYIEIDLCPAQDVIRQLDSVIGDRRRSLNPIIGLINATPNGAGAADVDNVAAGANTTINSILIKGSANSQNRLDQFPFVIGEKITFQRHNNSAAAETAFTAGNGGAASQFVIRQIISRPVGGLAYIEVFPVVNNLHITAAAALDGRVNNEDSMISIGLRDAASLGLSYTIDNLNLVVAEVKLDARYRQQMMAKAREGSSIEFDIYSTTNYKNSLLSSERQASFQIHSVNSRAKSVIILPTDSSVYTNQNLVSSRGTYTIDNQITQDTILNSARSGISGCCDGLADYQFQLDGKMVPSRPVDTHKVATRQSISAFHLFELEKTLDNSGIMPRNFSQYMANFVIGRGFAINRGVTDLRNKDLIVNLNYTGPHVPAPTKNKMFSTFVCHIRRISIKQGFVSVTQ